MSGPKIDDPDLPLGLLFFHWPQTAPVFFAHSMACFGCPIAPFHSVIDACHQYDLDETLFRAKLQAAANG